MRCCVNLASHFALRHLLAITISLNYEELLKKILKLLIIYKLFILQLHTNTHTQILLMCACLLLLVNEKLLLIYNFIYRILKKVA